MYTMVPLLFSPGEASCSTEHILSCFVAPEWPMVSRGWSPRVRLRHTHTDCYTLLRLTRSKAISLSQLQYIVYLLSIHSSVSFSITLTLTLTLLNSLFCFYLSITLTLTLTLFLPLQSGSTSSYSGDCSGLNVLYLVTFNNPNPPLLSSSHQLRSLAAPLQLHNKSQLISIQLTLGIH